MKNAVNEYIKEHRLETLFEVRLGCLAVALGLECHRPHKDVVCRA